MKGVATWVFFDDAHDAIGRGMGVARETASRAALERAGFVRGFARMCDDGWVQGVA